MCPNKGATDREAPEAGILAGTEGCWAGRFSRSQMREPRLREFIGRAQARSATGHGLPDAGPPARPREPGVSPARPGSTGTAATGCSQLGFREAMSPVWGGAAVPAGCPRNLFRGGVTSAKALEGPRHRRQCQGRCPPTFAPGPRLGAPRLSSFNDLACRGSCCYHPLSRVWKRRAREREGLPRSPGLLAADAD